MWSCIRNFVNSFCSESSVHGVKYPIKDKNFVSRCYWCVMLIFALVCCAQFSMLLSRRFLEIPIRMTIKDGQARTEELPLPSITFCTENAPDEWYERFLDEINIPPEYTREDILEAMRLGAGHVTPLYEQDQEPLNATLMNMLDQVLIHNDVKTREFMERVSVPCDVLLHRCELKGEILPCADIFKRVNGQCCRFIDNPETFVSAGNTFSNNLKVVTTQNYGESYLMIHRPMSEPLVDQAAFTMANGYYVMFYIEPYTVLKSEDVHEMEEETSACAHPDEHELRFFDSYDYYNCAVEWIINASIAMCGCAGPYLPAPDEYTCNFTGINCLRKYPAVKKMNYGLPVDDYLADLATAKDVELQICPEACTYTTYERNFKPRILVPEYDCTGFLDGVDPKNEYVVHFTYESQFYKIQEFVLVTDWITLLSNLGGVYGVFLGCSMLTLAEIIYYLWSKVISKIWSADRNLPTSTVTNVCVNRNDDTIKENQ